MTSDSPTSGQPPLLTDSIEPDNIPLLTDVIALPPGRSVLDDEEPSSVPSASDEDPIAQDFATTQSLRIETQRLIDDVIDEFMPRIEAEFRRRLQRHLDETLATARNTAKKFE